MKRYLFFQTPDSDFELDSPIFILCGSPRVAVLAPVSNASTFLWEQIEPDPITNPVSFVPNNTSKNITVTIPNNINTDIKLKVTLNGDINNFRIINIILKLIDTAKTFNPGTGLTVFNNTLNDKLPLLLAPYPPAGSQIIYYTNNSQTTSVRFLGQSYRQTYIDKIDLLTNNNVFIQEIDVFKTIYESFTIQEDRVNINLNTQYNILKKWLDIKTLSQEITPIPHRINLTFPTIIADDYISVTSGTGLLLQQRIPFTSQRKLVEDLLPNNFTTGTGLLVQQRIPFTSQRKSVEDLLPNNFTTGTGLLVQQRIPYTSNIVG